MGIGHIPGAGPAGPEAGGHTAQLPAVGVLYEGEFGAATNPGTWSLLTNGGVRAAGAGQQLAINLSDELDGGAKRSIVFTRDGEAPYLAIQAVIYEAQRRVIVEASGAKAQFTLAIADIDEGVTSGTATATGWLPAVQAPGASHAATGAAGGVEAPFPEAVAYAWSGPVDLNASPFRGMPISGWPRGLFASELAAAAFFDPVAAALGGDLTRPQADSPGAPGWHVMGWKQVLGRAACWGVSNGLGVAISAGTGEVATVVIFEAAGAAASVCNDWVSSWEEDVDPTAPVTPDLPVDEEGDTHVSGTSQDDPPPPPPPHDPDQGNPGSPGDADPQGGDPDPDPGGGSDPQGGDPFEPGEPDEGGGGEPGGGGGHIDPEDPGHEQN